MGGEIVHALNDIWLSVDHGDFIAIIGPSGSGKSTLMNVIGCLDAPTSGKYWLDGEEVSGLKENRLAEIRNQKIGFIFQGFNLLNKLSALENVELPLIYRGVPNKQRKEQAIEALTKVGLETVSAISQANCRADNNSALQLQGHWRATRRSCWRMNRPVRSIRDRRGSNGADERIEPAGSYDRSHNA